MTILTLSTTGTRNVDQGRAERQLLARYGSLGHYDQYVSGACIGWDAYAGEWFLRMFPHAIHRVVVPWDRSQVDYWWDKPQVRQLLDAMRREEKGAFIVEEMSSDRATYKHRNERLVFLGDRLFYCADYPEDDGHSTRSGTWQTVRMARRKEIYVDGVVLNAAV